MFQIKAKLLYNKRVKENYFHCALGAPKIALKASPGQFVNVRITDTLEPFLRRPFGIYRVKGKTIEILYEVLGKGTEMLSLKKAGEYCDIIGPLGEGFDTTSPRHHVTTSHVLVAGGMGVAPLVFLSERLTEIPNPKSQIPITVLVGAKTKNQILCEKEFRELGCAVHVATDDGSKGFKGKVTQLLKVFLRDNETTRQRATIYACGPRPMLKEVAKISAQYHILAQVSLEDHMACGIGACLGCVVSTKDGYKRVCKEGPVFRTDKIIWDQ